jgi:hypothetical protein
MTNRRPLRSRRARARIALSLCVLWVTGYEVMPWLHIATHAHAGKHHHDASGAIVRDDETTEWPEHEHDLEHDLDAEVDEHGAPVHHHHDDEDAEVDEHGVAVHHDHDDEDAEVDEHGEPVHHTHHHHWPTNSRDDLLRALGHGRHSLAHHAVVTTPFPPVLTEPLPVDRRVTFVFADTAIEPYSFSPGRAVARGPPAPAFES